MATFLVGLFLCLLTWGGLQVDARAQPQQSFALDRVDPSPASDRFSGVEGGDGGGETVRSAWFPTNSSCTPTSRCRYSTGCCST